VSVLEHLDDLDRAIGEIDRVLAPNGIVVGGFPVNNSLTGALFRLVGFRPEEIHPSSHTQILQALQRRFRVTRMLRLPRALPLDMCLYAACQCKKTVAGVRPSPTEETQE
jgi:SAM-dependent methyltransferase